MYIEQIVGTTLFSRVLFFVAVAFVLCDLLITLFTIFYQRYFYDRFVRKRFDETYKPKCTIFVPCKGVPKDLGKNLKGFLDLDYPDYSIVYSVESEKDEAVPIIRSIIADDSRAKMAVAGLSKTCVQKNHNLLAAVEQGKDADVYVFADADIKPEPQWLQELILPLADTRIAVTSGFRWLHAKKGTLGELSHSYVNIFIYVLFSVACFFGGVGLWGGSMAIRRKDFEELGVAEKWAHAGVDDMSLSSLVFKARKKAVVVPHCVIQTDDLLPTVRSTISWFERQIMYLKVYQMNLWIISIPIALTALLCLMLMPYALLVSASPEKTFFNAGGGAALVFYLGELLTVSLYPLMGSMYSLGKFILFWPFLRLTQFASFALTMITNTITWAGIKYQLAFNGNVCRIERPEDVL